MRSRYVVKGSRQRDRRDWWTDFDCFGLEEKAPQKPCNMPLHHGRQLLAWRVLFRPLKLYCSIQTGDCSPAGGSV